MARDDAEEHDGNRDQGQEARVGAEALAQSRTAAREPKRPCGLTSSIASKSE